MYIGHIILEREIYYQKGMKPLAHDSANSANVRNIDLLKSLSFDRNILHVFQYRETDFNMGKLNSNTCFIRHLSWSSE